MPELKGRKKHTVKGNVAPIKKSEEALGVESVGEKKRTNVLKNILKKDKEEKEEK